MITSVVDLIPVGKDNAISRDNLTKLCLEFGLIDSKAKDPDRDMRALVTKARIDWAIIGSGTGGYYRPSKDEYGELRKYVTAQEHKAVSLLMSLKHARAVLADIEAGRRVAELE